MIKTIEALFSDPLQRRALYFNLRWKFAIRDNEILKAQRDKATQDAMRFAIRIDRDRRIKLVLGITVGIVSFSLGFAAAIGLVKLIKTVF